MADEMIPIYGSPVWDRLTEKERTRLRHHVQAWHLSQFLHGEQGALVCTAKIVQHVPEHGRQVLRRHAGDGRGAPRRGVQAAAAREVRARLPDQPDLKSLLEDTLSDSRWDMTYLGMQVLIEGAGAGRLPAHPRLRRATRCRQSVNAYVMQDEARHVAFGRLALRDYYPQLTDAERDEREEFVVEGCYLCATASSPTRSGSASACRSTSARSTSINSELMRVSARACSPASCRPSRTSACGARASARPTRDMGILGFAEGDVEGMGLKDEIAAHDLEARLAEIHRTAEAATA